MNDGGKVDASARVLHRTLLRRIALGILVVGLSVAAIVFALAPAEPDADVGGVYVTSLGNSKQFRRELERSGGWAAVAAVEFNEWFDGLWHGRRLAGTLAVLAVGGALLCFLGARIPPHDD